MNHGTIHLAEGADLDGFRRAVRGLVAKGVGPDRVVFASGGGTDLFGAAPPVDGPSFSLPRPVAELVEKAVCHSDPERFALLYRLIWRLLHGERQLMDVASDPLVHRLGTMHKSVRRDLHKMHAFLRFRHTMAEGRECFVAWFEPDHFILEAAAPFFIERFGALNWSILTPIGSLHWDTRTLRTGPPGRREDAPDHDAFEAGWIGYYESTFNPARLNTEVMRAEMPKKYWRNLPEAAVIPSLVRSAGSRVEHMMDREAAMPAKRNPDKAVAARMDAEPRTLTELNRIIAASEPLVPGATQAVPGEGAAHAAIAFVGEQPGDHEDLAGRPFVGPAGQLLRRAMEEAGLDPRETYLTNAVKHFKFVQRGKRRIHQTPTTSEVKHYRWWLEKELDLVAPRLVVALGATAVLALAGRALPITRNRGEISFGDRAGFITVHPSYLLRLPDEAEREKGYRDYVADLRRIAAMSERLAAA
jgi:probable DNA metabolism protein